MSQDLTVNNQTFAVPTQGDNPGWGEELDGWHKEVTDLLASINNASDIISGSFTISNNVAVWTDILDFAFNSATVRGAIIHYAISRVIGATRKAEFGTIQIIFGNGSLDWELGGPQKVGNADVQLQITTGGQIQYKSSDMGVGVHTGVIKFSAKTFLQ